MEQTIDVNLFYLAFVCYSVAMFTYFFSFWKKTGILAKTGQILLIVGFVVQLAGLVIRSVTAKFMPVTNMYESLNFFTCAIVLAYIIVEKKFKNELEQVSSHKLSKEELQVLMENHILLEMPNVLITPHNAFNTNEALMRILKTTIDNIKKFKRKKLVNVVKFN